MGVTHERSNELMNAWGWVFMLVSLALVWVTTIWAYIRLLSAPPEDNSEDITR
jgi:hypothetical protein